MVRLRKYAGCMSMSSVQFPLVEGAGRLRCQPVELSKAARLRLLWFRFYETHDRKEAQPGTPFLPEY